MDSSRGTPILTSIEDVRTQIARVRARGSNIGFVPTMGALHVGHAELIRMASRDCDLVVVSIFINPTQFGPREDFAKYPRTLDADRELCQSAGADLIFAPDVKTMYPDGPSTTYVEVPGLSDVFEGAARPGHYRGVATVVLKLLGITRPDRAYFGQKDYQQQLVLRRMVSDLNVPVEIVTVPTVRESDGLAMSSRNRYLDAADRRAAVVLSRALAEAEGAVRGGERSADRVRQIMAQTIESERRVSLEYVQVVDAATLAPLDRLGEGKQAVALLAARVGPARLIDNAILPD